MSELELTDDSDPNLTSRMNSSHSSTSLKTFIFRSTGTGHKLSQYDEDCSEGDGTENDTETLEIVIPERMEASYGLYVWPCAPILAWYLFEHRHHLRGKQVLELGAGTALPGILCALCGSDVTLADSGKFPHCLEQSRKAVEINGLKDKVEVIKITWGFFLHDLIQFRGRLDIILGSDCFFDPAVFEALISTIAYLLDKNSNAKFLGTYQERSSDWSIESLLKKWGLQCKHIPLTDLASSCEVDIVQLMQDHTIRLIEITKRSSALS